MGTRSLLLIVKDKEYKLSQYNQFDGYPSGLGADVLKFLSNWKRKQFEENLQFVNVLSPENEEKINAIIDQREKEDPTFKFRYEYPSLYQNCGADVLYMIQKAANEILSYNSLQCAGESLLIEYAYLIDLDKNVLECYTGYSIDDLKPYERFYNIPYDKTDIFKNKNGEYVYKQIRKFAEYPLSKLPTVKRIEIDDAKFDRKKTPRY